MRSVHSSVYRRTLDVAVRLNLLTIIKDPFTSNTLLHILSYTMHRLLRSSLPACFVRRCSQTEVGEILAVRRRRRTAHRRAVRGLKAARAAAGFAGSQASEGFGQGGVCVCLELPDSTVPSHFLIPSSHLQDITHHGFVSFYGSLHDHYLVHLRSSVAWLSCWVLRRGGDCEEGRSQ